MIKHSFTIGYAVELGVYLEHYTLIGPRSLKKPTLHADRFRAFKI